MYKLGIRFLAGIFLISSATLSLEICLLRYFSIAQHYHFAFLVISISFMGYGASGSFLTAFEKLERIETDTFLSLTALLFSLSILASFLLSNSIHFDFAELAWDSSRVWLVFVYYALLSLPFFFAGLTISFAITKAARFVHRVYFVDLLGAGTGTILPLLLFLPRGDKGAILLISFLALIASLLFSRKCSFIYKGALLILILAETVLFVHSPKWLGFRISPYKALAVALKYPKAQHLLTGWNAVSRVDVIDSPAVRFAPGLSLLYREDLPPQLGFTIDGNELTAVTGYGSDQAGHSRFISHLPSSFAYSVLKNPKVLIIEPKGGLDVFAARVHEAKEVKVIESNPLITHILRDDLAGFIGKMYHPKSLVVETANSRNAINREKEIYDLIVFPLSDVFGSSGTGQHGFGENYLLTTESFARIFESLSPQGMISMSFYLLPPPRQVIRALSTWIQVLENKGKNPAWHLASLRSWGTTSLFIKRNPFSQADIKKLKEFARTRLFDLVYYPNMQTEEANVFNRFQQPIYHTHFLYLLSPEKRESHIKNYLFNIRPVSDNRPFFFNFFKPGRLKETYQAFERKWLPLLQGEYLIPLLLLQSALIAFVLILLPVFRFKSRHSPQPCSPHRVFLYFGLIGTAFMFIEITLIQKFILFLGQPLYSVSIVLFSLLLSSGLGSLSSQRILKGNPLNKLNKILLLLFLLTVFALLSFPLLFRTFMGAGFGVRLITSILSISALGFFMGFPFPSGIRLLESKDRGFIPWGWAANAFASVLGSITALMIAFWVGYDLVLLLAGACYLMALPFYQFSANKKE